MGGYCSTYVQVVEVFSNLKIAKATTQPLKALSRQELPVLAGAQMEGRMGLLVPPSPEVQAEEVTETLEEAGWVVAKTP